MQKDELNRLRDGEGRPPGVMGWWPSRATTFLENHDTVSLSCHTFFILISSFSYCGPSVDTVSILAIQHNMSLDFGLSQGFIDIFVGHAQLSIAVGKPLCSIGSSVSRLSLVMPFASCYSWITLYSELLQLSAYMHALSACLHAG